MCIKEDVNGTAIFLILSVCLFVLYWFEKCIEDQYTLFYQKLLEFWMSKSDIIEVQTIPHKLEVTSKILHLAKGKNIKIENSVRGFICTFAKKSQENEEILEKMTSLVINLCSVPNQSAIGK